METQKQDEWQSTERKPWKPTKEGEVLQGFLTQKRPGAGDKSAYYHITDSNDDLHIVWGSATLDSGMERVEKDDEVKITYNGTKDIGKKYPLKLFDVEYRKNPNSTVQVTEENIGGGKSA